MRDYVVNFLRELGLAKHMTKSQGEDVILVKYPGKKDSPHARASFYPGNPTVRIFSFFLPLCLWRGGDDDSSNKFSCVY